MSVPASRCGEGRRLPRESGTHGRERRHRAIADDIYLCPAGERLSGRDFLRHLSGTGHGPPLRLREHHDRCTPDSRRLAALPKSAGSPSVDVQLSRGFGYPHSQRERSRMRVVVVGTSGVGKTVMAKSIASALNLACIELDRLHWEPH